MKTARDTLNRTLPADLHDELERIYDANEDLDPRDVVAELHNQGLIDAGQLKNTLVKLETELPIKQVDKRPPQVLGDPIVLGLLGQGAMGEVLLAKDPGLNRIVAVKRIHANAAKNPGMMRRFYTEAQITAQLDHPSIVPIFGLIQGDDGSLSYAMKLVRGHTLEDYLEDCKIKTDATHMLPARLERLLHVCDAMAYSHERGIVHRDLKPENIMVGPFGEILIMDWGIAKVLAHRDDMPMDEQPDAQKHKGTKVGSVMGTPRYMSPEQAFGKNDILNGHSDQYALGLILQELVTLDGAIPEDIGLDEVLQWAWQAKRKPMNGPPELVGIVAKACQEEPSDRYDTVQQMADDIRSYLREEPVLAVKDTRSQKAHRWIGRHRRGMMLTVIFLSMALLATGSGLAIAGSGLLAWQQYAAQVREQQLAAVVQKAVFISNKMESHLHDIESLTTGMAFAADAVLEAPKPRLPYDVKHATPPNRTRAQRYFTDITVDYASVSAAKGFSPSTSELTKLAALGPVLTQAMAGSETGDARGMNRKKRLAQISKIGTPAVWARIGLDSGAYAEAPGTKAFVDDKTAPDSTPWFAAPRKTKGISWTGPTLDPRGLGQVVTVSVPWFDDAGHPEGVAAMDISVVWLAKQLTAPKKVKGVWLLNKDLEAIAWSGMDAMVEPELPSLPYPAHNKAIAASPSGWNIASDGTVAVWSRIGPGAWTYVVVSSPDVLTSRL